MKKIFTILLIASSLVSYSQSNFSKISVGFQAGLTSAFTGLTYGQSKQYADFFAPKSFGSNKSKAVGGSVDFYISPFISAGLEYNSITLKGDIDAYKRGYQSDFTSIEFRGTAQAAQFIDYSYSPVLNYLKNTYISVGLGLLSGKNNVANYNPANPDSGPYRRHVGDLGKSEFKNVTMLPVAVGYNFTVSNGFQEPVFLIGLNYKMNFAFTDDIDGFSDSALSGFNNKNNDVFTSLNVSVKFLFGPKGLFYKGIN